MDAPSAPAPPTIPAGQLEVRVARKTREAQDIISFELVAAGGGALPAFTAGAHVEVQLPFVRPGLARPYSLYGDPDDAACYRIAVLREPGSRGGSLAMHEAVHEGSVLRITSPRNQFALAPNARKHLLMAGGIGVTPLLSMAQTLAASGADFEFHYAARSHERLAFAHLLAQAAFAPCVHIHLDDGAPHQRLDLPRLLSAPDLGRHLYVCGPSGFMDAVVAQALRGGWSDACIHLERFAAQAPSAAGAFELELASDGRVIQVAADQTALQALVAAGVDVPSSCEQGVCGTCLTRVVSGEPDHHDQYLTPEEQAANDQFLPCCSRARSPRLVVDL